MSNIQIVPAILEEDITQIQERFATVTGLVDSVQIDICDGVFVPSETFGATGSEESFKEMRALAEEYDLSIELDMMVVLGSSSEKMFEVWMQAVRISGAKRVIFHFGSTSDWEQVFNALADMDVEVGIAVHIDSDLDEVFVLLHTHAFAFVQVMGIERVGYGGRAFDSRSVDIIQKIHTQYPDMRIAVDGGVSIATAPTLIAAGARQLAAGSAIFKASNPQEAIEKLAER